MQQRVGIARAIALKPKVLLLDEPFGRLDSLTRMELQDVILEIVAQEKLTSMIVTHDVDEAVFMSDRVIMMTNGPLARIGEVMSLHWERPRKREEILSDPLFFEYREHLLSFLEQRAHLKSHLHDVEDNRQYNQENLLKFSFEK